MRLHFPSVAVGVVAVALILISMSQAAPTVSQARVEYGPHPRDMVQFTDAAPFIVPTGHIFVLTALGSTFGQGNCILQVNGQTTELVTLAGAGTALGVHPVPTGFTAPAGSSLVILNSTAPGTARAWGYLSKQ